MEKILEQRFKLDPDKTAFILETRGMSARLAKTLDVKPMELSYFLRGKRHIKASVLIALCKATSKKPADFFADPIEKKMVAGLFST